MRFSPVKENHQYNHVYYYNMYLKLVDIIIINTNLYYKKAESDKNRKSSTNNLLYVCKKIYY